MATTELEQGWSILHAGILRLTRIIEGSPDPEFSASDYMTLFTVVYDMCTQNPPRDYSQQLYDGYALAIEEYILLKVLPSLREKRGESFLEEFVRSWSNHKVMVTRLSEIFHYLDRYFVKWRSVPNLMAVGLSIFRDLVYHEVKIRVRESVIFLVNNERDGVRINKHLIKHAVSVFLEIGNGSMAMYDNDFEAAFLENSFNYYLQKVRCWLMMDSCMNDMQMLQIGDNVMDNDWVLVEPVKFTQKVQECLNFERNHVLYYLHSNTEKKLLEKVEVALLSLREQFAE